MTAEAIIVELLGNGGDPVRYIVDETVTIEKGTILKFSADPRTVAAATADGDLIAGIAAAEKVANDGATTLAVYTNGIFDLQCDTGGTAVLGEPVKVTGTNLIDVADDATIQKAEEVVGYALETGTNNKVIMVRVKK